MVHPCPYPYGASEPVEKDGHLACFAEHIQVTDKAISENMRLLGCVCKTCKNCDNCCYDSTKIFLEREKRHNKAPKGDIQLGVADFFKPSNRTASEKRAD